MVAQELNYARNEIYARHGRKFQSVELSDYFQTRSWYQGLYEPENFLYNWVSKLNVSADGEYLGTTETLSYILNDIEISSNSGETILSKYKDADRISLSEDSGNGIPITADNIQQLVQ